MTQTPATIADLSQLTLQTMVQQSDRTILAGHVTKPGRLSQGDHVRFFITLDDDVPGFVQKLDPDAATAEISVATEHMHSAMLVAATFPIYEGYWFGKLHLAIDPRIRWNHVAFVAPDAFAQRDEKSGARVWRIATTTDQTRTDGEIVPGGWDHEHCELCWRKIGNRSDPSGFVSDTDDWVCEGCFHRYIETRDLRFILEGPWVDANFANNDTWREIEKLIEDYDLPALRRFLDSTASVNARNENGWTPLMFAASHGHLSLLDLLLDAGADVNAIATSPGYTALALAAQKGYFPIVERLLASAASVELPASFCGGSLLTYVKTGRGRDDARITNLLSSAGAR